MSQKINILVVDDLPEKLLVYRSILEEPGIEVVTARSGGEALRKVLDHDFAVILLDVNMPDMDGFETASMIRARRRSAHTPIIFVTAFADEVHAIKGYSHGAVDYILAPVVPEILQTKIRVFVQLQRLNQQVKDQAAQQLAQAQIEQARLAAVLENATDFVARADSKGRVRHINGVGRDMLGLDEKAGGVHLASLHAAWARDVVRQESLVVAAREGAWFGESALMTRSGREVPVSEVVIAHKSPQGDLDSFSVIARDIGERKRAEAELAQHRDALEKLVQERTAELNTSYERLRVADRLASIGTLAAGLGHDMGNLLLPVRMRLDSLERMALDPAAREDLEAIKTAAEYLKRLSQGLRLFALDPDEAGASTEVTDLAGWWTDVEPFLRNALPRHVRLAPRFPGNLPGVAMPAHRLTQVIFNLVQNAGDALRPAPSGDIVIAAEHDAAANSVVMSVTDNGPGMAPEVVARCLEPFFTTKTRGISTGLGLALVRGAVLGSGGTIDIRSAPGAGTTFRLGLPARAPVAADPGVAAVASGRALLSVSDRRLSAYVAFVLRSMNVHLVNGGADTSGGPLVAVFDAASASDGALDRFISAAETRRAILLGSGSPGDPVRVISINPSGSATQLRAALERAVRRCLAEQERAEPAPPDACLAG
ncbi:MAG TPA: response regulator [Phycisphaerales bacterium]|nr:response regulator [Phycisphaerales bacterium]